MIKVAIIIPTLGTGGAENMVAQLAASINRDLFKIHLLVVSAPSGSVVENQIKNTDIEVTYFYKGLGFNFNTLIKIYKYLNQFCPDIIHTHLSACIYAAPWAVLKKKPILHTVHNRPVYEAQGVIRRLLKNLYRKNLAVPIAISDIIARETAELYGLNPYIVETIYNPVDVARFSSRHHRKKIHTGVVFVNVARFSQQKNHVGLIDAFNQVLKSKPNIKLVLIGDGELRKEIEERVKSFGLSDRIEFTGNVLDIPERLANADIFVLPSQYEGLPLTILEAMAMGLPVVATAVGGVPDIVKGNGLLVKAGDTNELAEAMINLVDNEELRKAMGKIAIADVQKFDILEVTLQYEQLYEKYTRQTG